MISHHTNAQFFWLLLISFVVALVARRFRVPYALALVVTGLVIGLLRLLPQAHLEPELLFTIFLPPLIFESAIHLRIDELRRNLKPIAIYTLVGTVCSTLLVGFLAYWLLALPLASALVFGTLISATDPISVIAIFKRLKAGRRLTLIMEAESLFNDGVAVVLFTVLTAAALGGSVSPIQGIFQFLQLIVGGLLLGAAIGAFASRMHSELDDHLVEITLSSIVAFGSYLAAETLHVSGVMAVVASGLVVGNFGQNVMSPSTRMAITAFWEYAGFVVNSLIFLLIGIEAVSLHWKDKLGLALLASILVLIGRTVIYPLSFWVNRVGGRIPRSWQHVLVWGGLRGALSMALALGLNKDFPQRETLLAATFGTVLFSLLVQGLTVDPLLRRLGLAGSNNMKPKDERRLSVAIAATKAALDVLENMRQLESHPRWMLDYITQDYIRRLTLLENAQHKRHLPQGLSERQLSAEIHEAALLAEKNVFRDAERRGTLDEDDWGRILASIDAELLSLKMKQSDV